MNTETTEVTLDEAIAGFDLQATYIPSEWSHKKEDWNALKYVVLLFYKEKLIVTSEYSMGVAHIPGWQSAGHRFPSTVHDVDVVNIILRKGAGKIITQDGNANWFGGPAIKPELKDVLYALVQDGNAIDYADFVSWAAEYGYDTDSRKAERTYNLCCDIGKKLNAGLGYTKVQELREAFQDY